MEHGKLNRLAQFTHVLAVPCYSSLAGEIKLYSGDCEFADSKFKLAPYGLQPCMRRDCNDESCCLGVNVRWFLHKDYFARGNGILVDDEDVKWNPACPPMGPTERSGSTLR